MSLSPLSAAPRIGSVKRARLLAAALTVALLASLLSVFAPTPAFAAPATGDGG